MELIETDRFFSQHRAATLNIMDLYKELGRPSFSDRVLELISGFLQIDYYSAFLHVVEGPSQLLVAGGQNRGRTSADIAKAYLSRFAGADPIRAVITQASRERGSFAYRMSSDDVLDAQYRRICYDDPKIAERLTITSLEGGEWQSLNLYRLRGRPAFDAADLAGAMKAAAYILPLLPQHAKCEPLAVRGPRAALATFAESLRQLPYRLTPREVDVCARALIGMTAEATALDLGIAATSVATYRKRAYQRLGITSQNELFAALPNRQ